MKVEILRWKTVRSMATIGLVDEDGEVYEGIVKIIRMWTHYDNVC